MAHVGPRNSDLESRGDLVRRLVLGNTDVLIWPVEFANRIFFYI